MPIPVLHGVIERRILVNYRVAPDVLAQLLPAPFRPQLVSGVGVAGICLIRLAQVRPRSCPPLMGLRSQNAAHRIAVEWDDDGRTHTGVYVPRRDTSALINVLAGGRVFPGVHHRARFDVQESETHYHVRVASDDGTRIQVAASLADELPASSIFASLADASKFFEAGSLGYSATRQNGCFDGLELRTLNWSLQPLMVEHVASSFFDDRQQFPIGSVEFDSALLMRNLQHEWHGHEPLVAQKVVAAC